MAGLDENYASPNLRWALLLEDHPGAKKLPAELKKGTDLGVPDGWGGAEDYCVVTIEFPPESGLDPAVGIKAVNEALFVEQWKKGATGRRTKEIVRLDPSPEIWTKLSTMTLGRALKSAGYPDSLVELKALLLWRRRLAEVQMLIDGQAGPLGELPAASDDTDLDRAGKATPEHVGADDTRSPEEGEPPVSEDDGTVIEGDLVSDDIDEAEAVPGDDLITALRKLVGGLKGDGQKTVKEWCAQQDPPIDLVHPGTNREVKAVMNFIGGLVPVGVGGQGSLDDGRPFDAS